MKKVYLICCVAFFVATGLGLAIYRRSIEPKYDAHAIMANQIFILSPMEIKYYSRKALIGDYASSNKIADFYSHGPYDLRLYAYWSRISAENGDIPQYGVILIRDLDPSSIFYSKGGNYNNDRAVFWLCKVNGYSFAEGIARKYGENKSIKIPTTCSYSPLASHVYDDKKISEADKESLAHNALLGDSRASKTLYSLSKTNNDEPSEKYWLLISAENGDADSARLYSESLLKEGQGERAKFWAMKASDQKNQKS